MIPQPTQGGEARRESDLAPPQPAGSRWRHAFALASTYWTSKDWKFAWAALTILVVFEFFGAYVFVASNTWQRNFFDAVEQRNTVRFSALIWVFVGVMAMQVCSILGRGFVEMLLSIRWRTFLTERYVDRWMSSNRFADIERLRMIDNPDQRITVDIESITNGSFGILTTVLGFIGSTVSAISFVVILLETAEPIRFTAFGTAVSIPGSTVWYAVAYTLLGSFVVTRIGAPFIRARMRQQHLEADYRAGLMHVRRNAAQIGLAGAVSIERAALARSFAEVRYNFRSIISTSLGLSATQSIYERIGTVLPLFLMVPRYFAGAITFGQVMGARDAFQQLATQLSYFVQVYPSIGNQIAAINRLKGLDDAIDDARRSGISAIGGTPAGTVIVTSALRIRRPHGEPLLEVGDWTVRRGERWLVRGASGTGKSTLLQALAGLWPEGAGSVALEQDAKAMFVPQRLYLPLGTLKAAVCFPDKPEIHDDTALAGLLDRVRLGNLTGDIHAVRIWQEELSPGEQQRVALARILLHRPTLLVLDEATSALDPENGSHFYEAVQMDLPDVTLVSVIHDERLLSYHTHTLSIVDGRAVADCLS